MAASPSNSAGFTLVELIMGIALTTLVMAALSAVCLAVATGWRDAELTRSSWVSGHGASSQLQRTLRDVRYLGYVTPGDLVSDPAVPASIVYWRGDDFGGSTDGKIQVGELGLIEFDPATASLYCYRAIPSAQMTPAQLTLAAIEVHHSDLVDSASGASQLKTYFDSGVGIKTTLARHIAAAQFSTVRADEESGRPVVQYELRFEQPENATVPGQTAGLMVERGSATLRAPSAKPD
jgi:Tfp pilus assembly protein PilW